jgi:glycosyltransferase involved in cell wall biosynthesis
LGGNAELVSNGYNGFIVPHSNIKVIREKLITLLENDFTTDRFGRSAFDSAKRYNIDSHLDKLEELYHDVITEHGAA